MKETVPFFLGAIWMMFMQHRGSKGMDYDVIGPCPESDGHIQPYFLVKMLNGPTLRITVEEVAP